MQSGIGDQTELQRHGIRLAQAFRGTLSSAPGTAPSAVISCHHPANKSSERRLGISTADSHREYAQIIVSTGNNVGLRVCP
jgi:hypothetical protein